MSARNKLIHTHNKANGVHVKNDLKPDDLNETIVRLRFTIFFLYALWERGTQRGREEHGYIHTEVRQKYVVFW